MSPARPEVVEVVTFMDYRTDVGQVREAYMHHNGTAAGRRPALAAVLQKDLLSVTGYAGSGDPPRVARGLLAPRPRVAAAQATGARNTAPAEVRWSGPQGKGTAHVFLGAHGERYAGYLTFQTITSERESS